MQVRQRVHGRRPFGQTLRLVLPPEEDEPLGRRDALERQLAEQQHVDDAEDGAVQSNAKRQSEDGDQGEPGALDEEAQAIADVLEQRSHVQTLLVALTRHYGGICREVPGRGLFAGEFLAQPSVAAVDQPEPAPRPAGR